MIDTSSGTLLTAAEFSTLPEVLGYRCELIEGEAVLAPMPLPQHTQVIDNLERTLKQQFPQMRVVRESGWHVTSSGVDSVPGPDLMVVDPQEFEKAVKANHYFDSAPQFVVEVVSPSERKSRRLQKIGLYLDAGCGAVVEVYYAKRTVLVYRAEDDMPEIVKDRIQWPFQVDFADIFAGL